MGSSTVVQHLRELRDLSLAGHSGLLAYHHALWA